jgi:hypothetical protein
MTEAPKYETVAGTEPTSATDRNEPRTITKTTITGVCMMSEIDNGVFVAWTNCAKCTKVTTQCICPTGPTEPAHIQEWRTKRFEGSMRPRPKIRAIKDMTDTQLLAYLLGQYDAVTNIHANVVMDTPEDRELHDRAIAMFREAVGPIRERLSRPEQDDASIEEPLSGPTQEPPSPVNTGLDDAMAAVKKARAEADLVDELADAAGHDGDIRTADRLTTQADTIRAGVGTVGATGYVQPVGTVPVDELNPAGARIFCPLCEEDTVHVGEKCSVCEGDPNQIPLAKKLEIGGRESADAISDLLEPRTNEEMARNEVAREASDG